MTPKLEAKHAEMIKQLTIERDDYHRDRDNWRASCKQVENERDAAFVRGLERAREVAINYNAETNFPLRRYSPEEIANAIQAEIDKAKAGK